MGHITVLPAAIEGQQDERGASTGANENVSQREREGWRRGLRDRPARGPRGQLFQQETTEDPITRSPITEDKGQERRGRKTKSEGGAGEGVKRERGVVAAL